jgi:hypothetical protein
MGAVPEGDELYTAGTIAHKVLERAVPETLVHLWQNHASCNEIMSSWRPHINCVFQEQRLEQDIGSDIEEYLAQAENRLYRIANALHKRINDDPVPTRILTEVTITNTFTRHEGRIDAIFEHETANGRREETVEWKTYADKKMSEGDKMQTISNGMLVNHRYGRTEDDFADNSLTVITPTGEPEPTALAIDTIKDAREYVLNVLDGERVRAKLPYRRVCENCSYRNACNFYMNDQTNPARRKIFWSTRFRVLKERERAHVLYNLAYSKHIKLYDYNRM